jgi:aspartyl/glutamyl-tRNA(Asn/Gln) amidotransferase, C subunit
MTLSAEEVRKVALLSRLELDDGEIERQSRHLNQLIDQFAKLQELDVSGVEPTSHSIPIQNVMRKDAVQPSLSREEALSNAPEARDGSFVVPRVLEY